MFAQHSLLRCSPQVVTDAKTNHVTSYHRQLSSPGARGRYVIVLPGRAYLSNLNPTWRHVTASYADVATCGTNSVADSHCEIHGGSKQTNCHFSTAYRVFSTKISRFTGGGKIVNSFWKFHWNNFHCFKNYNFYNILFRIFNACCRTDSFWSTTLWFSGNSWCRYTKSFADILHCAQAPLVHGCMIITVSAVATYELSSPRDCSLARLHSAVSGWLRDCHVRVPYRNGWRYGHPQLLWNTTRKPYTFCRMVPFSMTLSDL